MTVVDPAADPIPRMADTKKSSRATPSSYAEPTVTSVHGVAGLLVGDTFQRSVDVLPPAGLVSRVAGPSGVGYLGRVRAWMVVPVVDFLMLIAPMMWRPPQPLTILAMAVLGTLLLTGGARYVAPLHLSVMDELPSIVTRLLATSAAIAAVVLHLHAKPQVLIFLETACQAIALVIVGRLITTRLVGFGRKIGIARHPTVLIGGGQTATEIAKTLADHREYGLVPIGFVDDSRGCVAAEVLPQLGRLADLDMAMITSGADTILVADGDFDERALIDAVRTEVGLTAELLVVPRLHHFHTLTGTADHIGSIPIMRIRNPNLRGPARIIKRLFDIVSAGAALLILSPVLAVAALAVRVEGGPGVIFRQTRVGRDGRTFELLKFRSMRPANEAESATQWNVSADSRVGPVGKFLRSTSIDELPQLWNILRGDMTIVGPRPERPHFVEQFSTQFDRYAHRHRVQVGLTGFAQVSGLKGDTSIADRCRYDNFYIENWSLWLDIKIILRTFRAVVLYRER
ncbi:sugar transferase [Arthrobacter sp. SLBN-53]|uniref:sugar transferase n=1 Tax=Arthrobacter sp. SLBN-53 TaxID=2768412 RepID=UPI001174B90A|nr:sugar transferase [Arthrobacter sp. SLBN-53]TQK30588.1 exopolysaccharide biosynthesis polyprenyl glycosylphosphotransferase [Arthrobacter sp. SLBN-53]